MSDETARRVEVVYGTADRQRLVEIHVRQGATCGEAVRLSGIPGSFPHDDIESLSIAVWGKVVPYDRKVRDGDRIEILRPLENDPRDARRDLATDGQYMGGSGLRSLKP
ncbi:MAG: RnfH family protein [Woeseiaceae bacterium]